MDKLTDLSSTTAERGLLDNQIWTPFRIACFTIPSSKSLRQTDHVRVRLLSPITTGIPEGLCILAPQMGESTVCCNPVRSMDSVLTRPAHWNGLPISACSSRRRTLTPPVANLVARYPPTGPAPTTTTSYSDTSTPRLAGRLFLSTVTK